MKTETGQDSFPPPDHLSEHSKTLWRAVVPNRARSKARLQVITTALEALDRSRQAAAILDKEGLTIKVIATGGTRVHPLVKVEAEGQKLFAKLWDSLSLNFDHEVDGRVFHGRSIT